MSYMGWTPINGPPPYDLAESDDDEMVDLPPRATPFARALAEDIMRQLPPVAVTSTPIRRKRPAGSSPPQPSSAVPASALPIRPAHVAKKRKLPSNIATTTTTTSSTPAVNPASVTSSTSTSSSTTSSIFSANPSTIAHDLLFALNQTMTVSEISREVLRYHPHSGVTAMMLSNRLARAVAKIAERDGRTRADVKAELKKAQREVGILANGKRVRIEDRGRMNDEEVKDCHKGGEEDDGEGENRSEQDDHENEASVRERNTESRRDSAIGLQALPIHHAPQPFGYRTYGGDMNGDTQPDIEEPPSMFVKMLTDQSMKKEQVDRNALTEKPKAQTVDNLLGYFGLHPPNGSGY